MIWIKLYGVEQKIRFLSNSTRYDVGGISISALFLNRVLYMVAFWQEKFFSMW